jgi:hypothetical protein
MSRRIVLVTVAAVLPVLLLVTVDTGVAGANPVFPGTVTCNAGSGVWSGAVTFSPALLNGGTATGEVVKVVAKLGNTASPCLTSSTPPAGSKVLGLIKGVAKFTGPGANNCATVFSGSSNVPVAAKFLMKWLTPPGAPTRWRQPPASAPPAWPPSPSPGARSPVPLLPTPRRRPSSRLPPGPVPRAS